MSKFTKGEWLIIETDYCPENEITTQQRINDGKISICGFDNLFDGDFKIEQDANAHLIAAAPDMYNLLSELKEHMNSEPCANSDEWINDIDLLIKKARGE